MAVCLAVALRAYVAPRSVVLYQIVNNDRGLATLDLYAEDVDHFIYFAGPALTIQYRRIRRQIIERMTDAAAIFLNNFTAGAGRKFNSSFCA